MWWTLGLTPTFHVGVSHIYGKLFSTGLILESGIGQSQYTINQIHRGRIDPKNRERKDGRDEYGGQIRTAGGYVDCKMKLKPRRPSQPPPKPFEIALRKREYYTAFNVPLSIGYGISKPRWMLSATAGPEFMAFKKDDVQLRISEVNTEEYDVDFSSINIEDVLTEGFKVNWGGHVNIHAEYRPLTNLGINAGVGTSFDIGRNNDGIPGRRWNSATLAVKWYL